MNMAMASSAGSDGIGLLPAGVLPFLRLEGVPLALIQGIIHYWQDCKRFFAPEMPP